MKAKHGDNKPGIFLLMLEKYLTEYLVKVKGYSDKTKASYTISFRMFVIYVCELLKINSSEITFRQLTQEVIEGFLVWLENEKHNSVSTRNCRLAALKSFAKYAENHDFVSASGFASVMRKVESKRGPALKRAYFTIEELKIFLDLPKLNTISGRRDTTLLHLMFSTGARAQEMCDLKVKDVVFLDDERSRLTITGKGRKGRKVIVGPEITKLLKKYIRFRRIAESPDAFVFRTQNNPQMSVSCVEEIFKKYIRIAKAENPKLFLADSYPPHSMRHTTAVCMISAGVPISSIQVLFGHAHIDTTMIYAEITQPSLDETVLAWSKNFWAVPDEQPLESARNGSAQDESNDDSSTVPDFLR